jgi:hypothetical protein
MHKAAQGIQSASTPGDHRLVATDSVAASTAFSAPSIAAACDPYEVWLTRVKRPRDQRVGPTQA